MSNRRYPAKVLLFGEYSILLGGEGISRPLHMFSGGWSSHPGPRAGLENLIAPLRNLTLKAEIDLNRLEDELSGGLSYDSDIPIGMGLGSSGALTAALYDRFTDHGHLHRAEKFSDLGLIEGALFHERSSGFDALVSLEDCDFRLANGEAKAIEIIDNPQIFIYLLDSGQKRSTGLLVRKFLERMNDDAFARPMEGLTAINQRVTTAYQEGKDYWHILDLLSHAQLEHMRFCILPEIASLWSELLHHNQLRMKLCGAGGGGYYLVFSRKPIGERLGDHPMLLVQK